MEADPEVTLATDPALSSSEHTKPRGGVPGLRRSSAPLVNSSVQAGVRVGIWAPD